MQRDACRARARRSRSQAAHAPVDRPGELARRRRPVLVSPSTASSRDLLYEMPRAGELPNLAALLGGDGFAHAYFDDSLVTTLPSTTMPAWVSAFTGVAPAEHGVTGNEYFIRERREPRVPGADLVLVARADPEDLRRSLSRPARRGSDDLRAAARARPRHPDLDRDATPVARRRPAVRREAPHDRGGVHRFVAMDATSTCGAARRRRSSPLSTRPTLGSVADRLADGALPDLLVVLPVGRGSVHARRRRGTGQAAAATCARSSIPSSEGSSHGSAPAGSSTGCGWWWSPITATLPCSTTTCTRSAAITWRL